jgi:hypothetical protein
MAFAVAFEATILRDGELLLPPRRFFRASHDRVVNGIVWFEYLGSFTLSGSIRADLGPVKRRKRSGRRVRTRNDEMMR